MPEKAASRLYNKYYRNLCNTYLPDTLGDDQRITYLALHKATPLVCAGKIPLPMEPGQRFRGATEFMPGWAGGGEHHFGADYLYEDGLIVNVESRFDKFRRTALPMGVVVTGFEYSYLYLARLGFYKIGGSGHPSGYGYQRFQGRGIRLHL